MVVRNTEKWIPGDNPDNAKNFNLANAQKLGPAVISNDNLHILVSFLDTDIRLDENRENLFGQYVLFVKENAPVPEHYYWQILFYGYDESTPDKMVEVTTDFGVISFNLDNKDSVQKIVKINELEQTFTISESGFSKIIVKVTTNTMTIPLEITHQIIGTFQYPFLRVGQKPGTEKGNPPTSSIVANDFRHFILAIMDKDNNGLSAAGISPNLLMAILYINFQKGLFHIALDDAKFTSSNVTWEKYLNDDDLTNDLPKMPVGIFQIKPHLLAMFLEGINGMSGTLMPLQVWETQVTDGDTYLNEVFNTFNDDQVSKENQVAIYNLLRFPKSSITVALTYLEKLKERHFSWKTKMLTKADHSENAECVKTIVSEYTEGPIYDLQPPTSFANKVHDIMYSYYIIAFSHNEVFLTRNAIYRRMMTNEFHEYDKTDFHPDEPENFLKRLTEQQKNLLFLESIEKNRLTAFITFGDGYAERLMGARFKHCLFRWDKVPGDDNNRLTRNLKRRFGILWLEDEDEVNIEKINDDMISVSTNDGKFLYLIRSNNQPRTTVKLQIDDVRIDEFFGWTEQGILKIYAIDNARPNASFALFNKINGSTSEMVFYTRFFTITYRSGKDIYDRGYEGAHGAKEIAKSLLDPSLTKEQIKGLTQEFFYQLSRMELINECFTNVIENPTKYLLSIDKNFGKKLYDSSGDDTEGIVPYITVKTMSGEVPKFMILPWGDPPKDDGTNINTIHGTLNTAGCWMLLRNHLWNWPRENDKVNDRYLNYELFSNIYTTLISRNTDDSDNLNSPPTSAFRGWSVDDGRSIEEQKSDILLRWWRNLNYFEFVIRFLGYQYKKEDKYYYSFPPNPELDRNGNAAGNNIFSKRKEMIESYKYKKGKEYDDWADLYLFKRTDRFTKDENDCKTFDDKDDDDC